MTNNATAKKVALVTGGVGGIGSAICRELALKGQQVVAGYHPAEEQNAQAKLKEWKQEGLAIDIASSDVANFASCAQSAKDITAKYGKVDILVNCAGITRDKTLRKMTEEDWQAVLNVDLNSLFNVTKQYIDGMTDRGYGRIVNISSVMAVLGRASVAGYVSAKHGLVGLTKNLAAEFGPHVTANAIAPGYIRTELNVPLQRNEDFSGMLERRTAAGRWGKPEDLRGALLLLASDAGSYITGHTLVVDGGLTTILA